MVKIGSARINEFGEISGGKAGDQTGKECMIEDWYLHKDGWVIIRAKNETQRKLIARDMIYLCENDYIGYDQPKDQTLYQVAEKFGFDCSKVNEPCDTDCARGVRVCLRYAGYNVPDFYTGNEIDVLEKTGYFEIIRDKNYTDTDKYLKVGDILCTPVKGHTVVVVSTGNSETDYIRVFCDTKLSGNRKTVGGVTNIREYAGKDKRILGIIPANEIVYVNGIYAHEPYENKKWYYVEYNGVCGFISELML